MPLALVRAYRNTGDDEDIASEREDGVPLTVRVETHCLRGVPERVH